MDILHVVVLMLREPLVRLHVRHVAAEDRRARRPAPATRATSGTGRTARSTIRVWNDPTLTSVSATIPDPDPGELYSDIAVQLRGLNGNAPMGGFVDNYMEQQPADKPYDPKAVMHYFTPDQVPVLSQLACEFGVSDRWFASAPCQTWPNRFFAHTGTAAGYLNNEPPHFPYTMPTVFGRLAEKHCDWRVYFHDFPQAATLATLWDDVPTHFRFFNAFARGRGGRRICRPTASSSRAISPTRSLNADSQRHAPAAQHRLWRAAGRAGLQRPAIRTAMEADAADHHLSTSMAAATITLCRPRRCRRTTDAGQCAVQPLWCARAAR